MSAAGRYWRHKSGMVYGPDGRPTGVRLTAADWLRLEPAYNSPCKCGCGRLAGNWDGSGRCWRCAVQYANGGKP